MKIREHRHSVSLLLLALVVPCASVWSQESAAASGEGFSERMEVSTVNVDVFVTDKKGRPITGLAVEDFELYEDGRRVPISHFLAVEKRRPVRTVDAAGLKDLPTGGERRTRLEPLPLPDDQRVYLIIYVDNFNIRPANRKWVMGSLRSFLYQHIHDYDYVMLVTYDRDIHVRQSFTDNPEEVMVALDVVDKLVGNGILLDAERRRILEEVDRSNSPNSANTSVRAYADFIYNGMSFVINSLRDMVSSLAGLKGRKALLHVSDGMPMFPAEDLFVAMEERWPDTVNRSAASTWDLGPRYRSLANYANSSGVTFYTLDSKGLQDDAMLAADEVPRERIKDMRAVMTTRGNNLREPLRMLAVETGGQAILGTNAVLPALDRVAEDFNTFYSLGYQPAHSGDGRYHKIQVKVPGKGIRVRHRDGYRDKTPGARMAEASKAVLHYGFETNEMEAWLEFGQPEEDTKGRYFVPVEVKVPIRHIAMVPQGDIHHGRLHVSVAVMDESGDVSPLQQQEPFDLRIPVDQFEAAQAQHVTYTLSLLMKKGRHRVVVGLQDDFGADLSFVSDRVSIAP